MSSGLTTALLLEPTYEPQVRNGAVGRNNGSFVLPSSILLLQRTHHPQKGDEHKESGGLSSSRQPVVSKTDVKSFEVRHNGMCARTSFQSTVLQSLP